jgi:hypothetical protein
VIRRKEGGHRNSFGERKTKREMKGRRKKGIERQIT